VSGHCSNGRKEANYRHLRQESGHSTTRLMFLNTSISAVHIIADLCNVMMPVWTYNSANKLLWIEGARSHISNCYNYSVTVYLLLWPGIIELGKLLAVGWVTGVRFPAGTCTFYSPLRSIYFLNHLTTLHSVR
jgi:hypothetical protein